jgi:lambda family phage minor tail protein L
MAAEGKNKVASSLLDLQPTAILELFRVFPDRINKPTLFLGFHGGAVYEKSIVWQGVEYLPLAVETEGFDILGDGKLARPKIRVANQNNIITNFLQNYKDFKNAKIVRKRVSVKFIDDVNFEGGNPFGSADPKAELTDETWLMGRKTQESKIFVEFELNSPLDLENFSVNNRNIVSKFCYWQYRGEGCRYAGIPIERADGDKFLDPTGGPVVPKYRPEGNANPAAAASPTYFLADRNAIWNPTKEYIKGDIAVTESPTILLPSPNPNEDGKPLKTVFVCVSGNSGQSPEGNPTYWQRDGCTKKLSACRKRFNDIDLVSFISAQNIQSGFSGIRISGSSSENNHLIPNHTGLFHSTEQGLTGHFTGAWTIMGWVNINTNSPVGAGVLSTTPRDDQNWPNMQFLNINANTTTQTQDGSSSRKIRGNKTNTIAANYLGYKINSTSTNADKNAFRNVSLHEEQNGGDSREWVQYVITNSTGTANFINGEGAEQDTIIKFFVNGVSKSADNTTRFARHGLDRENQLLSQNLGNFGSLAERLATTSLAHQPVAAPALPQTFMLGAVEYYPGRIGYDTRFGGVTTPYTTSMNGCLGPWAVWNRAINQEEIGFLYKSIRTPNGVTNSLDFVPRDYYECTGTYSGVTGDGLIAWWDGSTGNMSIGNGMVDIHTVGPYHLTGSGEFEAIEESYQEAPQTLLPNPTPKFPRFGGFPGTDGFSYGRNAQM